MRFSPSPKIVFLTVLLCFAGIGASLYLIVLHYQVHTNPAFHSFCAMSDSFNCETVAMSPFSAFLGMPVAAWGFLGYCALSLLALLGMRKHPWAYLALLAGSAAALIVSITLAVISYCVICSFCLMCSLTYLINTVLFLTLLWQAVSQKFPIREALFDSVRLLKRRWYFAAMILALLFAVPQSFPKYWEQTADSSGDTGTTEEGLHWIGAENPNLTIVEFSDYLCPYCRRAHTFQREQVQANSSKLRLVHRHFPLDNACNPLVTTPFHVDACLLARAAECAGKQDKFWEMNDLLFEIETLNGASMQEKVESASVKLNLNRGDFMSCMTSKEVQEKLRQDIDAGLELGIQGTPSFVVDSTVHVGTIPQEVIEKALRIEERGK